VPLALAAYERLALERALAETGGDAPEAARRLGLGRSTLYRKLARHGLVPKRN
jgi:propionate catabolism operon transcriptional regulator